MSSRSAYAISGTLATSKVKKVLGLWPSSRVFTKPVKVLGSISSETRTQTYTERQRGSEGSHKPRKSQTGWQLGLSLTQKKVKQIFVITLIL